MTTPTNETVDLDALHKYMNSQKYPRYPIDDHKYGAIQGHLTKLFGDDERRKFLAWAFGASTPDDRKNLSQAKRAALWQWLSPSYDAETNTWAIREECHRTAKALLRQWQIEAGQANLFDALDKPLTDELTEIVDCVWNEAQSKMIDEYIKAEEEHYEDYFRKVTK